ncbi:MAG: diguanylate cyclase [Burkholderiales bacterium]
MNRIALPTLRASVAAGLLRCGFALLVLVHAVAGHADDLLPTVQRLEAALHGFPQRTADELAALLPRAEAAPAETRRYVHAVYGEALVSSGDTLRAATFALAMGENASRAHDDNGVAAALLIRSAIEAKTGDVAKAMALARQARELATDAYLRFWAALALGSSARATGLTEESLANLQEALSIAEAANDPYRRSSALYQLSVLHLQVKNNSAALDTSLAAFDFGKQAQSPYAMATARIAESAVMEALERPARELAAMEEALAIARVAGAPGAEMRALVNLADIRLRRRQYADAYSLSKRALELARPTADTQVVATSMANMGFALIGQGRTAEGKDLTEKALAEYERAGAHAETAELIAEYARWLEQLNDFHGALALYHRERKLREDIALQTRERALAEVQEKYESEKRTQEISYLNRENELKSAELAHRARLQSFLWVFAGLLGVSLVVVAWLYRKLRVTNRLLEHGNAELSIQSSHDPLTGLFNRRYFQNHVATQDPHAERRRRDDDGSVRALMLIDIDHFKEINDRYGHAIGDAVLVAVANRLREALRETDTIVRWGGEEFLVYAATRADRVDDIAGRILQAVSADAIPVDDKAIRTTVSLGYMALPLANASMPLSWDQALRLVDMALYIAKTGGRNRAYGLQRLVRDDADALAAAERDLENAWRQGLVELQVLYGSFPASGGGAAPAPADADDGDLHHDQQISPAA